MNVGRQLNYAAIVADGNSTRACLYLLFVLLTASNGDEVTGISGIDSIGAIAIAIFDFHKGKEAFKKAMEKIVFVINK